MPPDAFGPFRVLHQIGAGALGPVFRAYEPDRDRLVAVKLFRLDIPPERVHQLAAEFDALIETDLSHAAVVPPIAAGIADVAVFAAFEFVSADSLDLVLRGLASLPVKDALRLVTTLAEALDVASARGIYHGALHPRDVLAAPDTTRLTGLGVVQALETIGCTTPLRRPYTPPERVDGDAWDHRADVFSLAAVTYELLWGRRLAGAGEQATQALTAIEGGDLTRLRRVFGRALAENPDDRYGSARGFVDALAAAFVPVEVPLPLGEPITAVADLGDVEEIEEIEESEHGDLRLHEIDEEPRDVDAAAEAVIMLRRDEEVVVGPPVEPAWLADDALLGDDALRVDDVPRKAVIHDVAAARRDLPVIEDLDDLDVVPTRFVEAEIPELEVDPEVFVHAVPLTDGSDDMPVTMGMPPEERPRMSPALLPIAAALVLGVAIGFAGGYPLGHRAVAHEAPVAESSGAPAVESAVAPSDVVLPSLAPAPAPALTPKTPTPKAEAPAPVAARLTIRSTPAGSRVVMDGKSVGRTPVTVPNVSRGAHDVVLSRDGYADARRRITVTAATPTLTVSLQKTKPATASGSTASTVSTGSTSSRGGVEPASAGAGTVNFESRPAGATVLVDGRPVGATPLVLSSLTPGEHEVRLEQSGYRSWISTVRVVAGERLRVAASLER